MPNCRQLADLPPVFQAVCHAFVGGLESILDDKLYGVYTYGAAVFADGGPVQDVDCHVILTSHLTDQERAEIGALQSRLADQYPPLGGELDAYFILYEAARQPQMPQHQLWPDIYDNAWALHCAHIRAGQYQTLHGPEPVAIFPAPTWAAVAAALDNELAFVRNNLKYPAFCVLNLCRIIYSFQTRDVVVSKRFTARWAHEKYPEWSPLIEAAERQYDAAGALPLDEGLASADVQAFRTFAEARIEEARTIGSMTREALERVRALCLALPETTERLSHGEPTFFVHKKVFVMFANNHHGDGRIAIWLPVPEGLQTTLIESDPQRYFRPPYVGGRGWVGIQLDRISDDDLAFHVQTAWELIAPKRLLSGR